MQIENIIDLSTETHNNMRLYKIPSGEHLPSITTILGQTMEPEKQASLTRWQDSLGKAKAHAYTKKAADKGTNVHLLIERYLKKEDLQIKSFSIEDVNVFTALKVKLNNIKAVAQEIALYSDELGVAGRCDCIGYYEGIPSIIDFKTSNKVKSDKDILDYKLQCTFYGIACNELYGTDINQGVILMSAQTGFPLVFKFELLPFKEELTKRIIQFYTEKLI